MGKFVNSSGAGASSKSLNRQLQQRDRNNNFYMNRSRNKHAGIRIDRIVGNHLNSDDSAGKKNNEETTE